MNSANKKLILCLFSDSNFLAVNILENLLSRNCLVNIVTDDMSGWERKTTHLTRKTRFSILNKNKISLTDMDYSLVLSGFSKEGAYGEVEQFISKYKKPYTKTLIVIPFEKYSYKRSEELLGSDTVGIVYLGDLLGGRLDLDSSLLAPQIVRMILTKREMVVGAGEVFYPLFVSDIAKTLTKWLFSFGPYGKETFVTGEPMSATDFWKENQRIVGDIKITYDGEIETRLPPKSMEVKHADSYLKVALAETYRWFSNNPGLIPRKKNAKRVCPKYLKPGISGALFVLSFPVFCLGASLLLYYLAVKQFISGQDGSAQKSFLIAKTFMVISKKESQVLGFIPVVGRFYKEVSFVSEAGERISDMGVSAIPVVRSATAISDKVLGESIYDPSGQSEIMSAGMDSLYRNVSLLQADAETATSEDLFSARWLLSRVDLSKLRNLTLQGKILAQALPSLLGNNKSKSYLLLFQNNMELRPTGGFIGSFGILTFDGGRISDFVVNDVYSADGQLNGHVEPPAPIKNYLGEANWWLRDSNWDPDFTTSAQRAEWFLDKETGRGVDGVIAIDLQPIKDILRYTGPIFLPDSNLDVTGENLYQKTQEEVEANFFPGTHRKASFLNALARSLFSEVSKLNTGKRLGILRSFYENLSGRHIQAFLHDSSSQKAISSLGWDGAINRENCGAGCFPDMVGVVEANVGVNKANFFIKRSLDLQVDLSPGNVRKKFSLTLENSANPALGLSGKYKVYLRLLTPKESNILSVTSYLGENIEALPPEITDIRDRKETGVLVEILGGQKKKIEFYWENDLQNPTQLSSYGLYIRKQAGASDDPIRISVNPGGSALNSTPKFSLTPGGAYVYNTTLTRDFFSRFSW